MTLLPEEALIFIQDYQAFLESLRQREPGERVIENLALARSRFLQQPELFETYKAKNPRLNPLFVEAISSLKIQRWVYLKDTPRHSVFMDEAGQSAYAVHGLTERLRDITGGSGCVVLTGLFAWDGVYVCDGIVANHVYLGSNLKREFADKLKILRTQGRYYASP